MTDKTFRKALAVSAGILMLTGAAPASAGQLQLAGSTKAAGQAATASDDAGAQAEAESETENKTHYMEALYNSNIRSKADSTSVIAGTVIKGDIIEVVGAEGNFLQVKKGNVIGYIRSDLLGETEKEVETETEKTAEVRKQSEVQSEKQTEKQSEKQTEIQTEKQTEVQTEKQSEIQTEAQTQAEPETAAETEDQMSTESSTGESEKDSRPRRARKYEEDAKKLPTRMKALKECNVRTEANLDSEVIASLAEGDEVDINGTEGDYYLIAKEDLTGYVYKDLLEDISEPEEDEMKEVTVLADCFLWSEASDRSEKITKVAAGTKITVSEGEYGYLKTEVEGKEGYINQYLVK